MSKLLEVQKLNKSFGKRRVLKDVSFEVPKGSIVGFIGDNGAGKSTTFKSILGLVRKDEGIIRLFGESDHAKRVSVKEKVGVVFDAMNLPAHLNVAQLNEVFVIIFKEWNQKKFDELIQRFSLPKDKTVNQFSRGMSMKLSVAVALSHNAKLLLLDEATGGLDPSSREELLQELERFVEETDGAILLSSHIMSDVEKIASHLVFIKDGEILLNEEKQKIFKDYAMIEVHAKQLDTINEEIVVAKRKEGSYYRVLVSNQERLPNDVKSMNFSIEEMTVLLIRGEN